MKKILKTAVCIMAACAVLVTATVLFADPGDSSDPVITLSYVEQVLMQNIEQLIDAKTTQADAQTRFQVIDVAKGGTLIGDAGTELILRSGTATIISTEKGGIANVTEGWDLPDGASMPANAHLIVPLADGRGFIATSDVIVMVKGPYTIQ